MLTIDPNLIGNTTCPDGCTPCSLCGQCGCHGGCQDPPKDCAGVVGGNAYLDECQECVGGNTGKNACDPCQQMGDELAAIFGEDDGGGLMAVRRKVGAISNEGRCAPEGAIYRNGTVVNWNDVSNSSENYVGVTISHSKMYLNNEQAINYIKGQRDLYNRISNFGASSVGPTFLIEKLVDWLLKKASNPLLTCLTTIYAQKYKELNSIFSELYDDYNEKTDNSGCYVIKTIITPTGAPVAGVSNVIEEFYAQNGCLIKVINYNN